MLKSDYLQSVEKVAMYKGINLRAYIELREFY